MSLPASQQRALDQIEITLADDHPGLGPLFAAFTRLVGHEAMPLTERVTGPRTRRTRMRMWPAVMTLVGLTLALVALLILSLRLSGPPVCRGTVTTAAVRTHYAPARAPACPRALASQASQAAAGAGAGARRTEPTLRTSLPATGRLNPHPAPAPHDGVSDLGDRP